MCVIGTRSLLYGCRNRNNEKKSKEPRVEGSSAHERMRWKQRREQEERWKKVTSL